jgi:hypothetical protein
VKIKSILKMIMMTVGGWVGLDWAADNPMKVKMLRNEVGTTVEQGYEFALFEFRSFQKEVTNQ